MVSACQASFLLASVGLYLGLSLDAVGTASGVANASLTKEQLRRLGAFVCDVGPGAITDSYPEIPEKLKLCPDLTAWQRLALNLLLSSGKTPYGKPASWDKGTLEALGPLAFYLNRTTWESVDKEERMAFFRDVVEAYRSQGPTQRQKTLLLLNSVGFRAASPARRRRATERCRLDPIVASTLEDPLFIVQYNSVEQFDACLSNGVLEANLAPLLDQPLPDNYLAVIKRKLDEIYPDGIPDAQLKLLRYLSRLYSPEEILKWRLTSGDTLAALLSPENGAWRPDQLRQLISTYLARGGTLTGPLLSLLGGVNLCHLEADQLGQISPESIRQVEKLDVSSCSHDKKDILYGKAREAFVSQEGTSAYYPLIQPYLGGAPAEDLRKLARSQVAMDIGTFTNLNPEELQKLSVPDVKDLLAVNLPDLKDVENHPSVAAWVKSRLQSELDTLGIGLRGGRMGPSPTGSTDVGGPTAEGPAIAVSLTILTATPTVSPASMAAISDANTATFSDTSTLPSEAPDSFMTPLFRVTPDADATSASAEATDASTRPPEVAISTKTTANVAPTSEDSVDGPLFPTTAAGTRRTATSATVASHNITANGTIGGRVATTASIDTTAVSTNVTTEGTILSTVASHSHTTASAATAAVSANVTTEGIFLSSVASRVNTTASVNTTVSSPNVTTARTILPTVAANVNVTSAPNTTIFLTPARNINHTSASPNMTVATLSKCPSGPPVPLPNGTAPPVTSGKMPAASSRTPLRSSEAPRKTAVSPTHGRPRTTFAVTPDRGTTHRAPPKTKLPLHPTPNGYINVRPLSASASSSSLRCCLLLPGISVGLSVLWRIF